MPTNRRYRARVRQAPIDPTHWALLTDAPLPADANPFLVIDRNFDRVMRPLWEEYGVEIVVDWIDAHPGTRPSLWWKYDAPRAAGQDKLPPHQRQVEPRRQILGEGVPLHEVQNVLPSYNFGIPDWCGDPVEAPIFESQHAYLKRHSLLRKGERAPRVDPFRSPAVIKQV